MNNGLPAGWAIAKLDQLGQLYCGQSPASESVNRDGRGVQYVTGPEQWDGSRVHQDKWTTTPKRVVPEGCVFITVKGAGVGTVFPGIAAAIGRDIYAFQPSGEVNWRFVELAIRHTVDELTRSAVGDIPGLSKAHILDHEVTVPPVAEQFRLVGVLSSYLSRLDEAEVTLDRVQRNLKRYRAAVLQAAVEGRLVPAEAEVARAEGCDYEPGSELLKRILAERRRRWEAAEYARLKSTGRSPDDDRWKAKYEDPAAPELHGLPPLPEGWAWTTFETVGDVLLGRQRAPQYLTGRFYRPYLRVANVKDDALDLTDIEVMDFEREHFDKYRLQAGDILVSEGQSPELVGQSAIYKGGIDGLCFQKTLHRFRPVSGGPSSDFVQMVLRAYVRSGVFMRLAPITTNIAHLTLQKFKRAPFPLPPATEQVRIVEECQRVLTLLADIQRLSSVATQRAQRLRQSILKWAFEGKLVDQDPNDEPASALLERIRAERAAKSEASQCRSRKRQAEGPERGPAEF